MTITIGFAIASYLLMGLIFAGIMSHYIRGELGLSLVCGAFWPVVTVIFGCCMVFGLGEKIGRAMLK